ncbi:hypothetical protein LR48_Vigan08g066600 [Vigna angularis]|uniref:Uncharacterized protein n=1 Tax=Phaseolus angularis TaxID=3914 RepID=A0A0L9V554_PHAAN|nr:hypothetical protein LR48_Vigan08g066600 [Vigna angularis]
MKRTHGLVWLHADSSVQLGQQRTSTRGPTQDHASRKWKREPADEGIHASSSLGDSAPRASIQRTSSSSVHHDIGRSTHGSNTRKATSWSVGTTVGSKEFGNISRGSYSTRTVWAGTEMEGYG